MNDEEARKLRNAIHPEPKALKSPADIPRRQFLNGVEIRHGAVHVTYYIEGLKAPFTKWDFLSDFERKEYESITFSDGKQSCSKCGTDLATEADFAKHYIISDVRYFNLGDCPNARMGSYDGEKE